MQRLGSQYALVSQRRAWYANVKNLWTGDSCTVQNLDQKYQITTTYRTPCLNVAPANTFEFNQPCDAFKELRHTHFPEIAEGKIGALLGISIFAFTYPTEIIPASKNSPFGVKTRLGWTLAGEYEKVEIQPKQRSHQQKHTVYHVSRLSSDNQPSMSCLSSSEKLKLKNLIPRVNLRFPITRKPLIYWTRQSATMVRGTKLDYLGKNHWEMKIIFVIYWEVTNLATWEVTNLELKLKFR